MERHKESWRVFATALVEVPRARLLKIYSPRNDRLLQRWGANPAHVEHTARNPTDRLFLLLKELVKAGEAETARMAVDILAAALGGRFTFSGDARADKATPEEEINDMLLALADLTREFRVRADDGEICEEDRLALIERVRAVKRQADEFLELATRGEGSTV